MTSAWTTPMTWTAGMVPSETEFNEQFRDNLNALKNPPFQQTALIDTGATTYQVSAGSFTAITGGALGLTTHGGAIQCFFSCRLLAGRANFNLDYNGTAWSPTVYGIATQETQDETMSWSVWVTGLPSGAHTFTVKWRMQATHTATMDYSGSPPVFWAREVS